MSPMLTTCHEDRSKIRGRLETACKEKAEPQAAVDSAVPSPTEINSRRFMSGGYVEVLLVYLVFWKLLLVSK